MSSQRRILHVDDDPQALRLVASVLQPYGFEVISLSDPQHISATLLESDCRVVLLDIEMPGIDGLELLTQIKKHDGGLQVIMFTGLVSMNTVLECLRRGAEACIFKPLTDPRPLVSALFATFEKLDRWWQSLKELRTRKKQDSVPVPFAATPLPHPCPQPAMN